LALNPEPLAVIVVPTGPLVGFIAVVDEMAKLALIEFVPSLTFMTWLPLELAGALMLVLKLPFGSLANDAEVAVTPVPS
jgi:hypothetical protein